MKIKSVQLGDYQTNCYLIIDESTNDAVIIDPGDDVNSLDHFVTSSNIELKAILLTHGHMDHTLGVPHLVTKYNVPVYINKLDEELMKTKTFIFGELPSNSHIVNIAEGDELNFSNISLKVIDTPGHTPGGVCFYCNELLFSGDTLFNSSIGRTDFPGGSFETLVSSILSKLLCLDDSTVVYSGHGPYTTIGFEKTHNAYLK